MEELVRCSYQRCYAEEVRNVTGDDLFTQELEACGNERVVRITLVNPKFQIPLASAVEHLIEAKLQIDKFGFTYDATTSQTNKQERVSPTSLPSWSMALPLVWKS